MFKRFVEGASIVCLVLALAAPAFADIHGQIDVTNAIARDAHGRAIHNTFYQSVGDCEADVVYGTTIAVGDEHTAGTDTIGVAISSGGMPAWLMLQIPEEATLTVAFVRFKESVDGSTFSYTWGDWCPLYIGEAYREFAFNVGLWDSCHISFGGSAYGLVDAYWRMERISDD